jgi:hypothetical protein
MRDTKSHGNRVPPDFSARETKTTVHFYPSTIGISTNPSTVPHYNEGTAFIFKISIHHQPAYSASCYNGDISLERTDAVR